MAAAAHELNAAETLAAFSAAADYLTASAAALDAINVYPVPDGDTGSNMSSTLQEAVRQARDAGAASLAEMLAALAKGALYGARGNSGVILSQALKGFAAGVGESATLTSADLADGLASAAEAAYRAVATPQEGTMLTVLGAAARGAAGHEDIEAALAGALAAGMEAEAGTIDQLEALRAAGVVDAGGEGVCALLRGTLAAIRSERIEPMTPPAHSPVQFTEQDEGFGFCTEFVIEAASAPVDEEAVRRYLRERGTSVVAVGDTEAVRVHVHVEEPDALLAGVAAFGRVLRVKVEDMDSQHGRFRASGSGSTAQVGVLAIADGHGFEALFGSLGADVFPLGETQKPSAGQIAEAADALRKAEVIVLPNHPNVRMAALQAVDLASATLTVIATDSLPGGLAACVAFDERAGAAVNSQRMAEASDTIATVEVTWAVADRIVDGVTVVEAQAVGLVGGKVVVASDSIDDALITGLHEASAATAELVTLYAGTELKARERDAIEAAVVAAFPEAEVEVIDGGQRVYAVIASVE